MYTSIQFKKECLWGRLNLNYLIKLCRKQPKILDSCVKMIKGKDTKEAHFIK